MEASNSEEEKERLFFLKAKDLVSNFYHSVGSLISEAPDTSCIRQNIIQSAFQASSNMIGAFHQNSQVPHPPRIDANIGFPAAQPPVQRHRGANEESKASLERVDEDPNIDVNLEYVFDDYYNCFEDVLESLNGEASKLGYKFNKGPMDKARGYFSAYCKYKYRNKERQTQANSLEEGKEEPSASQNAKKFNCSAYYRLRKVDGYFKIIRSQNFHSHEGCDMNDITETMKLDLKFIRKNKKIIDVIDFLESKYKVQGLNYQKVYYHFRKLNPLFGLRDCAHFVNYLKSKDFHVEAVLQEDNETLCKLFFSSPVMTQNYSKFGDILIMDATYNVNKYKIPLLIFSGIAADGRNVVFAMACLNNETYETYSWALKTFFKHHKKRPKLFVTDGDLALCKAVDEEKEEGEHYLCQWHMVRNFSRNFSFLKVLSEKLYKALMKLPYVREKEKYDAGMRELKEFLQQKGTYAKSVSYLENIDGFKNKWANAYKPLIFSAGANTTSRAESTNSLVKRYLDRQSELSSMIELVLDLDRNSAFKVKKDNKEDDPILICIKPLLGEIIYLKHQHEFERSKCYSVIRDLQDPNIYQVLFDALPMIEEDSDTEPEIKMRTMIKEGNIYSCSCGLFVRDGIICRHLFCLFKVLQIKDIPEYLHNRWLLAFSEKQAEHEIDPETLKALNREERIKNFQEEKEMDKVISFNSILDGARRIKKERNRQEKTENKPEDSDDGELLYTGSDEDPDPPSKDDHIGEKKKVDLGAKKISSQRKSSQQKNELSNQEKPQKDIKNFGKKENGKGRMSKKDKEKKTNEKEGRTAKAKKRTDITGGKDPEVRKTQTKMTKLSL